MYDRSVIICSESDVDLKDKIAMSESIPQTVVAIFPTLDTKVMDEKTLADVIRNSQGTATITHLESVQAAVASTKFCYSSQVLGQEWVVPNIRISEEIKNRNPNGYVYVVSQSGDAKAILVLCEEIKDIYEDGSYRIRYNPVTHYNVKRMSE